MLLYSQTTAQLATGRIYWAALVYPNKFVEDFGTIIYSVGDGMRSKSAQKSASFKVNNSKVKVMN